MGHGRCPSRSGRESAAVDGADAAVDRQDLAGDVLAGRAGEQDGGALEVVIIAEAAQRRLLGQRSSPRRASVPRVIRLGKKPGASALTVMPWRPHSPASARVKLITAPLLVL